MQAVRVTVTDRLNPAAVNRLAQLLDAALPQTQCTRCGYPDCAAYAHAIADGSAEINQCPPGGEAGVARLALLTGKPVLALNPVHGVESIRHEAVIDEAWCIGCTLCLKACPVDCIVGAPKLMHTVIEADCTGCELCLPACPVDCISMRAIPGGQTGWLAWSDAQAAQARERYAFHREREQRDALAHTERLAASAPIAREAACAVPSADDAAQARRAVIEAAIVRARAARTS